MKTFNNVKELFEHLLSGGKVGNMHWSKNTYIHIVNSSLKDEKGKSRFLPISSHVNYYKYKEPEVYEFECTWKYLYNTTPCYPVPLLESFDFKQLIGKKTKVKIEVIDE